MVLQNNSCHYNAPRWTGQHDHGREVLKRLAVFAILFIPVAGAADPASPGAKDADRAAIEAVLATYTKAVSNKDQRLFETLLLNKSIPFSYVPKDGHAIGEHGTEQYEVFRKGVFEGPPFTQRFEDVRIQQQGGVADVTLVFVDTTAKSVYRGWKTIQLLRVDGVWKIASEFFTDYPTS
jgi:hypothetical protein